MLNYTAPTTLIPRSGSAPDGRKVKGTIHWVSANDAIDAEVRLYDRLFKKSDPDKGGNFLDALNSDSCIVQNAKLEPCLNDPGAQTYQFERLGYFKKDEKLSLVKMFLYESFHFVILGQD